MIADLMQRGLTQMEIERLSGVDQSTVSAIHTGRRGKRVSYEVMSKLKRLHDAVLSEKNGDRQTVEVAARANPSC